MKICLVTGGSRGIGAATVCRFAQQGYTVIANYHNSEAQAKALQADLAAQGCDVHLFRADISDVAQTAEMMSWIEKYFKHLDVLINNAGVALTKQIQDVTEQDFDRLFAVNVKGAYFCTKAALPLLQKQGGAVVNVASIWGLNGASCESVYSMTKHAVVGMTKSLAQELVDCNITVNCVCPPIVDTAMAAHLSDMDKSDFCKRHQTAVYTPQQVAQDIFRLACCGKSGQVLAEK